MSEESWEWDGCCSACQVMIEWNGDDPESEEEAVCHECKVDSLRAQLAASEAKAEAAEREAAELRSVYEHPNESGSVVGGLLALIKSTEAQRDEAVKALEAIASCGFPSEEADLARSALARIRGSR